MTQIYAEGCKGEQYFKMLVRIWLWPNEHQFYFLNICQHLGQHLVQNLGHHISQHLCQLPGQHLSQIFYQHSGQHFLLSSWLVPFSKFHITEKTVLLHTYIQTDMSKLESCFATKNQPCFNYMLNQLFISFDLLS